MLSHLRPLLGCTADYQWVQKFRIFLYREVQFKDDVGTRASPEYFSCIFLVNEDLIQPMTKSRSGHRELRVHCDSKPFNQCNQRDCYSGKRSHQIHGLKIPFPTEILCLKEEKNHSFNWKQIRVSNLKIDLLVAIIPWKYINWWFAVTQETFLHSFIHLITY